MTDDTNTTDEAPEVDETTPMPDAKDEAATDATDDAALEPADDPAPEVPVAAITPEERARAARSDAATTGDSTPVRAVAKYLRFSAQKGRLVVDQIRGKRVLDAATALAFSDRGAAREIMKVLKSAVANAEHNHGMRADQLYVSAAFVDEGPTFKRWKPRARGRVDRIMKRTCHITIIVDQAPAALLEGRAGKRAAATTGDRSARVAGSRKSTDATGAEKKPAAKKKPAATKTAATKETAPKVAADTAAATSGDEAADAASTEDKA